MRLLDMQLNGFECITCNVYFFRNRNSWNNCIYEPGKGVQLSEQASLTTVSLANEASVEKFGMCLS